MQIADLQAKITRSIPQLSPQDLVQVAALIESLASQKIPSSSPDQVLESRRQWVDRLRLNRSRLSVESKQQTVVEMRQEERY
jgi:cytochrome c